MGMCSINEFIPMLLPNYEPVFVEGPLILDPLLLSFFLYPIYDRPVKVEGGNTTFVISPGSRDRRQSDRIVFEYDIVRSTPYRACLFMEELSRELESITRRSYSHASLSRQVSFFSECAIASIKTYGKGVRTNLKKELLRSLWSFPSDCRRLLMQAKDVTDFTNQVREWDRFHDPDWFYRSLKLVADASKFHLMDSKYGSIIPTLRLGYLMDSCFHLEYRG